MLYSSSTVNSLSFLFVQYQCMPHYQTTNVSAPRKTFVTSEVMSKY